MADGLRWVRRDAPTGEIVAVGYAGDEPVVCEVIGWHGECADCGRPLVRRHARSLAEPVVCEDCVLTTLALMGEPPTARRRRARP